MGLFMPFIVTLFGTAFEPNIKVFGAFGFSFKHNLKMSHFMHNFKTQTVINEIKIRICFFDQYQGGDVWQGDLYLKSHCMEYPLSVVLWQKPQFVTFHILHY